MYVPSPEFLLTALIVVLVPGTGVIYTVSSGLLAGRRAGVVAAFGCTLGILPALVASIAGLAALLHASTLAFQVLRIVGAGYLLYLAWGLWRDTGSLVPVDADDGPPSEGGRPDGARALGAVAFRGALINTLNPKLSIFFLAFLPQFVPAAASSAVPHMLWLGAMFMAMTFVVFVGYGVAAAALRRHLLSSARAMRWLRRTFALAFAGFAAKLAVGTR